MFQHPCCRRPARSEAERIKKNGSPVNGDLREDSGNPRTDGTFSNRLAPRLSSALRLWLRAGLRQIGVDSFLCFPRVPACERGSRSHPSTLGYLLNALTALIMDRGRTWFALRTLLF